MQTETIQGGRYDNHNFFWHPVTPADHTAMAGMRAIVEPNKGRLRGIGARKPFDSITERVAPPSGVEFCEDTVGGVKGWWCTPEDARPGEVILHLHGGWFNWGTAQTRIKPEDQEKLVVFSPANSRKARQPNFTDGLCQVHDSCYDNLGASWINNTFKTGGAAMQNGIDACNAQLCIFSGSAPARDLLEEVDRTLVQFAFACPTSIITPIVKRTLHLDAHSH